MPVPRTGPALAIVRRDLKRLLRSPLRTVSMFAMPLMLAAMLGFAFGGGDGPDITLRVLLLDQDQGLFGQLLRPAADRADGRLELVAVDESGFEQLERGEASALLRIPPGFTDALLEGRPTTLELIKNPAERFLPVVAEEGATLGALGLSEITMLLRPQLDEVRAMLDAEGMPTDLQISALATGATAKLAAMRRYLFPPRIALDTITVGDGDAQPASGAEVSVMGIVFPGLAVLGMLFLAQAATRDILRERLSGQLRHLLSAPVTVSDYLAGKCLSVLTISGGGLALLIALGHLAGVRWGAPLAVAALVAASALAIGGLLLAIMSLTTSERQQDSVTTIVIMLSAILGGSMVPLAAMPDFLLPLSKLTLNYWATDGFTALILHGGSLADVATNLIVLSLTGALLLTMGITMLRRRIEQGGV